MFRVGLTGGLASGKSFVGRTLEELGCYVVRADQLGHDLLMPGAEAYPRVVAEFGPSIVDEDGTISRRRLAAEVFGRPERLEKLNALLHPLVIRREEELLAAFAARDPQGIAVVEAAILIETGSYKRFDKVVVAACRPEQQVQRAIERGLSRQEALNRLARQMPLEEKMKYADFVVDTSGEKEDTLRQVRELYGKLKLEH
jgi:dephospho-CoA kinase